MPYIGERSKHSVITDLINSEKVKTFLSEMQVIHHDKKHFEKIDNFIFSKNPEELNSKNKIKHVFSFDGSNTQVLLNNGFPGAEVGILKISQCFIQLELMKNYEREEFPHPAKYDEIFLNQNFEITLPGFNVGSETYKTPRDFFRFSLFNHLKTNYNTFIDILINKTNKPFIKKTFLATYSELLLKKKESISCEHPCELCASRGLTIKTEDFQHEKNGNMEIVEQIKCKCKNNPIDIFITDLLHFHEGFSSSGSNTGLFIQVMGFFEKLIFTNLLLLLEDFFPEKNNQIFQETAFILDGPLAIYNHASWFSQSILDEIIRINETNELLIIGVEKTGHFVEHLQNMDNVSTTEDKPLAPGFLFFIDDNYIKRYIKYSTSPIPYGQNYYFGKKLFYKNKSEQLFVINMSYNSQEEKLNYLNNKNDPDFINMQPRLNDLVWILENYSSSNYKNALSFVSMAHENASISNNEFSKRIIDDFINENTDKLNSTPY